MSAEQPRRSAALHGNPAREPRGLLPAWPAVVAVVAHPDDESFGLGAIIDRMTSAGATVHVLCYTRGEASTLNQTGADLLRQRAAALALARETSCSACSRYRTRRLAHCQRPGYSSPGRLRVSE